MFTFAPRSDTKVKKDRNKYHIFYYNIMKEGNMFKTEGQALRDKRNHEIADRYCHMRLFYPKISDARIFDEISKDYNICAGHVRVVCKKMGVC